MDAVRLSEMSAAAESVPSQHAVSVVVPTFRRPDLLDRCLAALLAQRLPDRSYEIIVADDAADPRTRDQVRRWEATLGAPVRYIAVSARHGPAAGAI